MTDPVRWSEDPNAPDGLRELLRAAKPDEPSASELGRMRGHVLAPKAALISATTTKIMLIGLFAVGIGAAVVHHALARDDRAPPTTPAPQAALAPEQQATNATTAQGSSLAVATLPNQQATPALQRATPAITTIPRTAVAAAAPSKQRATSPTTAKGSSLAAVSPPKQQTPSSEVAPAQPSSAQPSQATPTESPIAEATPAEPIKPKPQLSEVALLERARASLHSGNATDALALAERAAVAYPDGVLAEERDALAIEALIKLGRTLDARAKWTQFASSYPHSNYRARLQHYF